MANRFVLIPHDIYKGLTTTPPKDTGDLNLDFVRQALDKVKREPTDPTTKYVHLNQELRRYLHLKKLHDEKPIRVQLANAAIAARGDENLPSASGGEQPEGPPPPPPSSSGSPLRHPLPRAIEYGERAHHMEEDDESPALPAPASPPPPTFVSPVIRRQKTGTRRRAEASPYYRLLNKRTKHPTSTGQQIAPAASISETAATREPTKRHSQLPGNGEYPEKKRRMQPSVSRQRRTFAAQRKRKLRQLTSQQLEPTPQASPPERSPTPPEIREAQAAPFIELPAPRRRRRAPIVAQEGDIPEPAQPRQVVKRKRKQLFVHPDSLQYAKKERKATAATSPSDPTAPSTSAQVSSTPQVQEEQQQAFFFKPISKLTKQELGKRYHIWFNRIPQKYGVSGDTILDDEGTAIPNSSLTRSLAHIIDKKPFTGKTVPPGTEFISNRIQRDVILRSWIPAQQRKWTTAQQRGEGIPKRLFRPELWKSN